MVEDGVRLLAGPVAARFHVTSTGPDDAPVLLLAHGFACDQGMWRDVVPLLRHDHRVVMYDVMGAGRSDTSAYDPERYAGLEGYADDLLAICEEQDLRDVTVVAHSVSTMVAVLAALQQPHRFRQLFLLATTPYLLDDPADGYEGGFAPGDLDEISQSLDTNYFAWSHAMAPVFMGTPDRPELGERLADAFCRADPDISRQLIRTMFATDYRPLLGRVSTPVVLLQSRQDAMVPDSVGPYVHERMGRSTLVELEAVGHCPHVSAPAETARAVRRHLLAAG